MTGCAKRAPSPGIERLEMAAGCGVTERTISNYELDQTKVPKLVVAYYAARCDVSYDWLCNDFHPEGTTIPITECYSVSPLLEVAA